MAYSYAEHVGNGTTGPYSFSSLSLLASTIESIPNQLSVFKSGTLLTYETDYTISEFNKTITLLGTPAYSTDIVRISRNVKKDARYVDYVDSTNVTAELLDLDSNQLFYTMQEAYDTATDNIVKDTDGQWMAQSRRIKNMSPGIYGTDAVNLNQLEAATTGGLTASLQGYGVTTYTGNGSNKTFAIPVEIQGVSSPKDFEVHVSGVRLVPTSQYNIVGTNFVLADSVAAPSSGASVMITYPRGAVSAFLTANSVATNSIQEKAVTVAKINNGSSGQFLKTTGSNVGWAGITSSDVSGLTAAIQAVRLDQLAAPTGNVSMNSNRITNCSTPLYGTDAANRNYVDGVIPGITPVDLTPYLKFGTSAEITTGYATNLCRYFKIGRMVTFVIRIVRNAAITGTGSATITFASGGLPQASFVNPVIPVLGTAGLTNWNGPVFLELGTTANTLILQQGTGSTALTNSNFTGTTAFTVYGSYISAS